MVINLCLTQGGRKRCSTVALLQGTKAKREEEKRKGGKEEGMRRKRRGREEKRGRARVRGNIVREGEKE